MLKRGRPDREVIQHFWRGIVQDTIDVFWRDAGCNTCRVTTGGLDDTVLLARDLRIKPHAHITNPEHFHWIFI